MSTLNSTVPELLQRNAKYHGKKIAFSSPGRTVTHSDLLVRTGRIACSLKEAGIGRGHYVFVLLDRCVEAVESILAIIRTRAIAVPLDPRCSQAELAIILDDVRIEPRWAITNSAGAQKIREIEGNQSIPIWTIDDAPQAPKMSSFLDLTISDFTDPPDDLAPTDKAFIFYTSGSTGSKAKGVVSSQESWIRSTQSSMTTGTGVRSDDKMLCPLPITHAFGFSSGVMVVLCTGASMHMTGQQSLSENLAKDSYTVIIGVPTHYSELVSLDITKFNLASIRLCVSGGAAASVSLNRQVEDKLGVSILNHYGCTETCGIVTVCHVGSPFVDGSCGQLVPGREVRIVDPANQQDVEGGDEGEIWIRSSSLLIEYLNDSASPVVDGWYRSGDTGNWDDQQNLMITGRLKETIVRGGENIHPAEIERVLNTCPGVKESVVLAAPHDVFGEVPVAYVVPKRKTPLSMAALIATCRKSLASHKVPADYFEIDSIPLTRSGKPRRRAVGSCPKRRFAIEAFTAASIENIILAEFSHARGIPAHTFIDPTTQFGDIGMNSLVGIVIRDRLISMTGLALPMTLLFDHPTPRSLAEHIHGKLYDNPSKQVIETPLSTPLSTPPSTSQSPNNDEPVAIVSMSCRYPGGIASPEDLWRVVEAGIDVTSDFPTDRGWDVDTLYNSDPDVSGTTHTRRGGFLHDMADFDAHLLGMSPREALTTDPQQRLLLESTWDLTERADLPPLSLRGSNTGVYLGVMYNDYAGRFTNEKHEHEGQLELGSAPSVAAGRVSNFFDFHGPSLAIDTACSSSLVAIDQAAKALRSGECSLAVAGGVTVMATPQSFVMFSMQRGLSPDGRCRSYSDDANGTAWSEGVGLLLLERLSDARRNGHQVLGLIRGVATNSDGRSSTLTSPSGPQQERVIQTALRNAGLSPGDIDVIEGHGTATPLGDPIEVRALMATYGQTRPEPALLGSLKSNLGHTQAAAGVASIIKMVMAMQKGFVPATLHVTKPSRHVDWSKANIELATKAQAWPKSGNPRRAAVSAFGIGGTNAHVIIEQGDITASDTTKSEDHTRSKVAQLCPWLLSGADESALQAQAHQIQELHHLDPSDVAYSLVTTRSLLRWRAAVPPGDLKALGALAQGTTHPRLLMGQATAPRLVILFSGQGGQYAKMFEELNIAFPIFENKLKAVCDAIDVLREEPLLETLRRSPEIVDRTDISQSAIFAFQVALYRTLEHFGVVSTYLVGHSVGEVTAAHVSGVLSLKDAAKVVATRGGLMNSVEQGAMASIEASEVEVQQCLLDLEAAKSATPVIAAVNSESSVVISGTHTAVALVEDDFRNRGRRTKRLRISHACHSPAMNIILPNFLDEVLEAGIEHNQAKIPIISTVIGALTQESNLGSPEYWIRQVRAPVRFADAISTARDLGGSLFLEIGPSAALSSHVQDAVPTGATVKSLLEALTALAVQGYDVAWLKVLEQSGARKVKLPTYPFQRRRFWLDPPRKTATRTARDAFLDSGTPVPASGQIFFSGYVSLKEHFWLRDHVMMGKTMLPATAFVEMASKAGKEVGLNVLEELTLLAPLDLSSGGDLRLQMILDEADPSAGRTFNIFSRPAQAKISQEWTQHASGALKPRQSRRFNQPTNTAWPTHGEVDIADSYDRLNVAGVTYGPAFRCVKRLWQIQGGFVARLVMPDGCEARNHLIHPVLLDAALHASLLAVVPNGQARLPFRLAGIRLWLSEERELRTNVHNLKNGDLAVRVFDLRGYVVAEIKTVSLRPLTKKSGHLFALQWTPVIERPIGKTRRECHDHIIRLRAQGSTAKTVHEAVNDILAEIRDWNKTPHAGTYQRLTIVTERATTSDPDLACAAVWGFVRSAQSEADDNIVLIDLDGTKNSEAAIKTALASNQTVLAIRGGETMSPRLVREITAPSSHPMTFDGTVLITGGTGALGSALCRHLVLKHGVKSVLVTSRSGVAPDRLNLAQLTAHGASIAIKPCDVADYNQLKALLEITKPAVTAIFHAAGVLDDGTLDSLTPSRITKVLRPKVNGAWNLHSLLPIADPFVLFSSAAGILGNPGQANYAAGNTYLDALARHRVHHGLHAVSLAWGPWKNEAGMAGGIVDHGPLLPMSDEEGMDLLDAALGSREAVVVPLVVIDEVPGISRRTSNASLSNNLGREVEIFSQVDATRFTKGFAELQASIGNEVANVLGYDKLPDLPFREIGVDSLTGVLIRNKVAKLTGVSLPSSVMFEVGNVEELAKMVLEKLGNLQTSDDELPTTTAENEADTIRTNDKLDEAKELSLNRLFHKLCLAGHYTKALGMLTITSLTLPTFTSSEVQWPKMGLRPLKTSKHARAAVICLPDFLPPASNNSIFAPLTSYLSDDIDVYDLVYPTETLPDTMDTLTAIVLQTISDRPFILLGFSVGGLIAHKLARSLRPSPAGLILLDTYPVTTNIPNWLAALPARQVIQAGGLFNDRDLAVMGHYMRITQGYIVEKVTTPTLFVKAGVPIPEMKGEEWEARWPGANEVAAVEGDHVGLLSSAAEETAEKIDTWIDRLLKTQHY